MAVEEDEIGRLQAEVQALRSQVSHLELRVGALEGQPRAASASTPSARSVVESRVGLKILNRVGALTLAIGILFFFKYAVDLSWMGPKLNVSLGILAGCGLLAASAYLNRRGQKLFAQGIAGCGLATLYISIYAAFFFYKLIPKPAAFLALLGICAFAIRFSLRDRTAVLAAFGFLGGMLTLLLLHGSGTASWLDLPYLFVIDLTCVVIAMRQRWPVLIPLMGTSAIIFAWMMVGASHRGWFAWFGFALAALHIAGALWKERSGPVHDVLYFTGHGCFALAVLRALDVLVRYAVSVGNQESVFSELGSVFLGVYGVATLT